MHLTLRSLTSLLAASLLSSACGTPSTGETTDGQTGGESTTQSSGASTGAASQGPTTTATTDGGGSATGGTTGTASATTAATTEATSSTSSATGTSDPGTTAGVDTTGGSTGTDTTGGDTTGGDSTGGGSTSGDTTGGVVPPNPLIDEPNLWYSVDKSIVYIQLSPVDGSVVKLVHNQLSADVTLWHGQNGLTMIDGGALLGSRESAQGTQIYLVGEPPITENTPANAKFLGTIAPDKGQPPPRIEALYTDCSGRVYLMDTGKDVSSADGNRLLRFTGDYLAGDLAYEVITDLQKASVADIDDMSPGVVNGEINDKVGFAMDSTMLWQIDYITGTGKNLAQTSGTWGVHALGGPLFDDKKPRLYVLSQNAALFRVALDTYASSPQLAIGPDLKLQTGYNGWSGLAGPLTECMTLIPQ